jgi:hypothetical protein
MKYFIFLALVLFVFSDVAGQSTKTGPNFDITDFNRKLEVVQWLVEYDTIAWKTTDVVLAKPKEELTKLGGEWFCFQDEKSVWHAVYGKLVDGKYQMGFHLVVGSDGKITETDAKIDADFLNAHANALSVARLAVRKAVPTNSPTVNQYIKRNADRSFTVWLLPAFLPNGTAVYGPEFIYTIDPTGTKILKDESDSSSDFRGFATKPPREIWLNYRAMDKPSLGAIFFVWYYKEYFTSIIIDNAKSTSTVVKDGHGGYIWLNVEKDDKPAKSARL